MSNEVRVWLSGSLPAEGGPRCRQDRVSCEPSARELFRSRWTRNSRHHPSVTPHLLAEAEAYQKATGQKASLTLVVSQFYAKDPETHGVDLARWNALSDEGTIVTREAAGASGEVTKDASLRLLRQTLLEQSNVMVAFWRQMVGRSSQRGWSASRGSAGRSSKIAHSFCSAASGRDTAAISSSIRSCGDAVHNVSPSSKPPVARHARLGRLARRVVEQIERLRCVTEALRGRPLSYPVSRRRRDSRVYTAAILAAWERSWAAASSTTSI